MPAPILRRYATTPANTAATTAVTVPAARALVISKITCANVSATAASITVTIGGAGIVAGLSLAPGQVYTETGLVALAGEAVACTTTVASAISFMVHGEEVDN